MYDNKIHHTTFFSLIHTHVHGIHMLPILPTTGYIRSANFVREEWTRWFDGGRAEKHGELDWIAVLYANLAVGYPETSWKYFSNFNFGLHSLNTHITASLSWYLWYAAALGGAK
jgi:endo-1,3(4)-beta-glucanase